jgi:hypothetical protein
MRKLYLIALVMALMLIGSAVVAQQPASKLPWPPDTTGGGDECYWIFPPQSRKPSDFNSTQSVLWQHLDVAFCPHTRGQSRMAMVPAP